MRNAKDALEYVYIPPGTFKMGCVPGDSGCDDDEKPRHEVTITRGVWLGKTEVTWGAYRRFFQVADAMGNKGSGAGDRHPVVNVSWNDAVAFCSWSGGRLPTEAEWEYAARGGVEGKKYPWGNSLDHEQANYSGTGGRDRWDRTSPVGSFAPNGYGLYDMAGNVWEWVWDWYDANYDSTASGSDPARSVVGHAPCVARRVVAPRSGVPSGLVPQLARSWRRGRRQRVPLFPGRLLRLDPLPSTGGSRGAEPPGSRA